MASVDFLKIHGAGEARAMIRHSENIERLRHDHSNKDIDKSRTIQNINHMNLNYEETCRRYDARIQELDSTTNTNRRKDRVTLFSLEIPAPAGMSEDLSKLFFNDVFKLICNRYGKTNIINAFTHYDEIHSYIDHGEVKESRPHIHIFVVPEQDGQLCGKKFSSKSKMQSLNREIDNMCNIKYHFSFLTHEKPRKMSVEELKQLSDQEVSRRDRECAAVAGEIQMAQDLQIREAGKNIFGRPKDKIRISWSEYQTLQKTARAVEDAKALQDHLEAKKRELDQMEIVSSEKKRAAQQELQQAKETREQAEMILQESLRQILLKDQLQYEQLRDFISHCHGGSEILKSFDAEKRERSREQFDSFEDIDLT